MRKTRDRFETIKKDLYNQWLIFKRMPIIILYTLWLLGSMSIMVYLLGSLIILTIGAN